MVICLLAENRGLDHPALLPLAIIGGIVFGIMILVWILYKNHPTAGDFMRIVVCILGIYGGGKAVVKSFEIDVEKDVFCAMVAGGAILVYLSYESIKNTIVNTVRIRKTKDKSTPS